MGVAALSPVLLLRASRVALCTKDEGEEPIISELEPPPLLCDFRQVSSILCSDLLISKLGIDSFLFITWWRVGKSWPWLDSRRLWKHLRNTELMSDGNTSWLPLCWGWGSWTGQPGVES